MLAAAPYLLLLVAFGGQIVVVDNGDQKIALSGVIQPQVDVQRTASKQPDENVLFRRLIAEAQVTASADWSGDVQVDFGESTVLVKNAYLQYAGWRAHGLTLTLGHAKLPFSRSYLTSGVKRETAERPFTGDRNFGTLNRALGVRVDGAAAGRRLQWSAGAGLATQIAKSRQLTFDAPLAPATPLTTKGPVVAGRVEWHPLGDTPRDQGDFHTPAWRTSIGVGAFRWQHADRTTGTGADLDSAAGLEVSGALRGHGLSADVELHRARGIARDAALSAGIYRAGIARLRVGSYEAGYMLRDNRVELVTALDSLDADTYAHQWRRFSSGANVYLRGQSLKLQLTDRANWHVNGGSARLNELFAQCQLLF